MQETSSKKTSDKGTRLRLLYLSIFVAQGTRCWERCERC